MRDRHNMGKQYMSNTLQELRSFRLFLRFPSSDLPLICSAEPARSVVSPPVLDDCQSEEVGGAPVTTLPFHTLTDLVALLQLRSDLLSLRNSWVYRLPRDLLVLPPICG